MYVIKDEYLQYRIDNGYSENTIHAIKSLFSFLRKYEEEFGKDACQFSLQEIKQLFEDNGDKTLSTLRSYICHCRDYTEYCIRYHSTLFEIKSNAYLKIEPQFIESLRNQKALTESDFTKLINACDDMTDLFIILGIYRGMTMLELNLAEYKHIKGNFMECYDLVDGEVVLARKIYIDEQLRKAAKISSETYKKVGLRADGHKDARMYYGQYIIKDGRKREYSSIVECVQARQNKLILRISALQHKYKTNKLYANVRKFGISQTVIELMSLRGAYKIADIGMSELQAVNTKYNMDISIKKLKQIMKDYLEE